MAEKDKRSIIPRDAEPGMFKNLFDQLRLVLRLMADRRVSVLLKLLPLGSLVYLIFPDLMPTPIDDAVVLGVGLYLFVELCPDEVVEEHRAALRSGAGEQEPRPEDVVDADFHEGQEE